MESEVYKKLQKYKDGANKTVIYCSTGTVCSIKAK